MKKIVSAALAAVAAGFATAEIKTSLNVRAGGNVFNKADTSKDAITIMDLDGVTGTDALTFSASNDYAGVKLNYNPKLGSGGDTKNSGKDLWTSGNGVEITGWMKPAEWLKLQVGATKDGIFYVEQAKKDTDDTNWSAAGKYAFLYKPGVLTKNSSGFYLDSLVDIQNNGDQYAMANLAFGVGDGKLGVDLVATSLTNKSLKFLDDADKDIQVAPGARVYFKNDAFNVNLDFQMPTEKDIAFGIYASPLGLLDNALQLMAGFTFSTNTDDDAASTFTSVGTKDTSFFAVDLRVRYVAGDFHIANAFNFTGASEDDVVKGGNGSKKTGDMQIWDGLFLTYKLNDQWTITGDVQIDVVTGVGTDDDAYLDLYVTPGVAYTVGKGASITTGLNFIVTDLSDNAAKKTAVALPVIFRVKM